MTVLNENVKQQLTWANLPISQVCCPTPMTDPRQKPDEWFCYVDISAIDRIRKVITSSARIAGADAPSRARKEIRAGDILVSTVRPNLNAVALVPSELDKQVASTGFCVLRPKRAIIEGKYLFYFATTHGFIDLLTSKVRGAHYPAVSDSDIKQIEVPLPPPSEQRRIVEILDRANELRKNRLEADTTLSDILPALFYKMFGDPAANPFGWIFKPLSKVGAEVRYGLGQPPATQSEGIPLIRATNISAGTIVAEDLIHVDPDAVPASRNAFLRADEVLVVRSGAYTGDIAQVTKKWEGAVAGYDLVVSPGQQFTGEFIEAYLLTPFIQKGYFHNLKARAGQPHLNAEQVADTPIPIVPTDRQSRFASCVNSIRELRDQSAAARSQILQLFDALLHRAFSANLTAKWREANMKELLDEMEQQARILSVPKEALSC